MENEDLFLIEKEAEAHLLYDGRIIKLRVDDVTLPDGKPSKREYVSHNGGAAILAVDDEDFVYLVRQFRYPYREVIYEIPAGKLEVGEEAIVTAERELEEEVGLNADEIIPYGMLYPSPGYTNENLYIFLAKGLKQAKAHLDDEEFLNVHRLPYEQVLTMVMNGQIRDAKTCYAILRFAAERHELCH
ncbi:MAG: NUDIX hydrolase [Clostridiales bacterium]|nr:NUDIX hydrolase [Clostridiales bacterium]